MHMSKYLEKEKEEMPKWLKEYNSKNKISFEDLFSGNVVYYAGSKTDGAPIAAINKSHMAHVYFYVDDHIEKLALKKELMKDQVFRGYKLISMEYISSYNLINNKILNISAINKRINQAESYCLISLYERSRFEMDIHGPKRFVLVNICANPLHTYISLFTNRKAPIITVLANNYGEVMNQVFKRSKYSKYLLAPYDESLPYRYYHIRHVAGTMDNTKTIKRALYQNF